MSAAGRVRDPFETALARVRAGGLVAYPTETVWGLGADASSAPAMERLRAWKGREGGQPVAVLVDDVAALAELGIEARGRVLQLAHVFWPGPLTLVLPCARGFAPGVAREDGAVGVRCSPHPVAAALARRLREAALGPITATSLNRHGEPPARTRHEALGLCVEASASAPPPAPGGASSRRPLRARAGSVETAALAIPAPVTEGGPDAGGGPASTVVDATGAELRVLRYGALGPEALAPWLGGDSRR